MMKIKTPICNAILLILTQMTLLVSCSDDENLDNNAESTLSMDMRSVSSGLASNISIYIFDPNNKFIEKKLNVARLENILSTNMKVGTWNLVLLTGDNTDISKNTFLPTYQSDMDKSIMWKTNNTSDGMFLAQTPEELRYASIPNTVISGDQTTTRSTNLYRNVAKIQVILEKYSGFDVVNEGTNEFAFVELLDVPTTLSWDGKLYPDKINPVVSNKPIREYLNFNEDAKADTINFIIPAHRGDDAFLEEPKDITTHKLRLRASMPLNGMEFEGKGAVEIPFVPKINSIIQIKLTLRGEPNTSLDMKVSVKDWADPIYQYEEF